MENSILLSTKKILGVSEDYTAFDLDIITHINAAFSTINQLGVGPSEGFSIQGEAETWLDLELPIPQLSLIRTYVFLRVRLLFDPPGTSFLINAMNDQIKELEWRLNALREESTFVPEVST
jgi:hypothetical protein